jgi:hypothetical protein
MPISGFVPRQRSTRRLVAGAFSATVFLVAGCTNDESPASPQSVDAGGNLPSNVKTPVEGTQVLFYECLGEEIRLEFREQLIEHESLDAQGRLHIHTNINDKGSTAVGLTSGTTYHQVGATKDNDILVVDSQPRIVSFVNVLNLIGHGFAPNLLIHESFHLTLDATGGVTVERETERITCK